MSSLEGGRSHRLSTLGTVAGGIVILAGAFHIVGFKTEDFSKKMLGILDKVPTASAKDHPETALPNPEQIQKLIEEVRSKLNTLEGLSDQDKLDVISECLMPIETLTNDLYTTPEQDGGTQVPEELTNLYTKLQKMQIQLLTKLYNSDD